MTIEQFRATGKDCANLGDPTQDEVLDGCPGRIYCDVLYIEKVTDSWPAETREKAMADGGWYLVIGNCEWIGQLADLEVHLHEYAVSEGYFS